MQLEKEQESQSTWESCFQSRGEKFWLNLEGGLRRVINSRDGSGFENLGYPSGFSNTRKARSPKIEKLAKPEKARSPNSKPAGFFGLYSSYKIPLFLTFSLCFLIKNFLFPCISFLDLTTGCSMHLRVFHKVMEFLKHKTKFYCLGL